MKRPVKRNVLQLRLAAQPADGRNRCGQRGDLCGPGRWRVRGGRVQCHYPGETHTTIALEPGPAPTFMGPVRCSGQAAAQPARKPSAGCPALVANVTFCCRPGAHVRLRRHTLSFNWACCGQLQMCGGGQHPRSWAGCIPPIQALELQAPVFPSCRACLPPRQIWSGGEHRLKLGELHRTPEAIEEEGPNVRAHWCPQKRVLAVSVSGGGGRERVSAGHGLGGGGAWQRLAC